jgi:hypothetical protein
VTFSTAPAGFVRFIAARSQAAMRHVIARLKNRWAAASGLPVTVKTANSAVITRAANHVLLEVRRVQRFGVAVDSMDSSAC